MTTAWDALLQGKCTEALQLARAESESEPDDINRCFFLAQLLIITGDPDAALAALDVTPPANPRDDAGHRYHLGLLRAEKARLAWLSRGEGQPAFAMPPPPWATAYLEAHQQHCRGDAERAAATMRAVHPDIPGSPGLVDNIQAVDVRDVDDFLGPFLEVLAPDLYLLIPLSQLQSLQLSPPENYPELLWRPADVTLVGGSRPPLRLPTLYAGVGKPDDAHRSGAQTTFLPAGGGLCRGMGQRQLLLTLPDGQTQRVPLRGLSTFSAQ
jgi:protein involved in temperature-dependent protein secretion